MGLLYPFPISTEESEFVQIEDSRITLKSYGLPYLFWAYATGSIMIIVLLLLAAKEPTFKLIQTGDDIDKLLAYSLLVFGFSLPIVILSFFFFEKRIIRKADTLIMEYRIFYIPFFKEQFTFKNENDFIIDSFLDSPNHARLQNGQDSLAFQNKGYFVLKLKTDTKNILIDRHSRKVDLEKLKSLILFKTDK